MIIVFHNTQNNDEMVGLNIRHLFMFDWAFIIIVFKNM